MIKFVPTEELFSVLNWFDLLKEIRDEYGDRPISFDPEIFKESRNIDEVYHVLERDVETDKMTVFVTLKGENPTVRNLKSAYRDLNIEILKYRRRLEHLEKADLIDVDETREINMCREKLRPLENIAMCLSRALREEGWRVKYE